MQRIAIDMDEVLADTLGAQLDWLRERFGHRLTPADVAARGLEALVPPDQLSAQLALFHDGSFFADLPVMPGAVETVRRLAEDHEICVVSAATQFPASMVPKLRWLERHFPFIAVPNVVFCGEKGVVAADWLVDDNAHRFPRFGGRAILYDAPHNRAVGGYPRARSWAEVEALVRAA